MRTGTRNCSRRGNADTLAACGIAGAKTKNLLVPAQAKHAHSNQRLSTREIDGGFQEHAIYQLDALFCYSLLKISKALRTEVEDRDDVVDL